MTAAKQIRRLAVFAILAAITGFYSCEKNEQDEVIDTSKNYIKYDGREYSIVKLGVVDYGDYYENGTQSYGLRLYAKINSESDDSENEWVEIDILLEKGGKIPNGESKYSYSSSHKAGTMDAFLFIISGDNSDDDSANYASATLNITDSTMDVVFRAKTQSGIKISGHYNEKL